MQTHGVHDEIVATDCTHLQVLLGRGMDLDASISPITPPSPGIGPRER